DANDHRGLWVSDGTAAGTHELAVSGANPIGLYPSDLTVFNGEVLFRGTDTSGITGLWVTDGTAAGTPGLAGISGAGPAARGLSPSNMTVFNGEVLFNGTDASGQLGLWVTDGTAAGTHELTGISGAATPGLWPVGLTAVTLDVPLVANFDGGRSDDVLFQND